MLLDFILPCTASFFASMAFALIYNIRGKNLFLSSLCGAFGWAAYLICDSFADSAVIPYLLSGMAIALFSEIAAYIFRSPVTVYLMPGFIPLVPGGSVYLAVESCLYGDIAGFASGIVTTLKIGGAIALGLIFMSSIFRLLRAALKETKKRKGSF